MHEGVYFVATQSYVAPAMQSAADQTCPGYAGLEDLENSALTGNYSLYDSAACSQAAVLIQLACFDQTKQAGHHREFSFTWMNDRT